MARSIWSRVKSSPGSSQIWLPPHAGGVVAHRHLGVIVDLAGVDGLKGKHQGHHLGDGGDGHPLVGVFLIEDGAGVLVDQDGRPAGQREGIPRRRLHHFRSQRPPPSGPRAGFLRPLGRRPQGQQHHPQTKRRRATESQISYEPLLPASIPLGRGCGVIRRPGRCRAAQCDCMQRGPRPVRPGAILRFFCGIGYTQKDFLPRFSRCSRLFSGAGGVRHRKGYPMRVCFYTLGCKVNLNETGALEQLFERNGFTVVPEGQPADVYIVNSCTVTNFGDQKSRKWLPAGQAEQPRRRHRPHRLLPPGLPRGGVPADGGRPGLRQHRPPRHPGQRPEAAGRPRADCGHPAPRPGGGL